MKNTYILLFMFLTSTSIHSMQHEHPIAPIFLTDKPLRKAKKSLSFQLNILNNLLPYSLIRANDLLTEIAFEDEQYPDNLEVPIKMFNWQKEGNIVKITIQSRYKKYRTVFLKLSQQQATNENFETALQNKLTAYKKK